MSLGATYSFVMYGTSAVEFSSPSTIPSSTYTVSPVVEPVTSPMLNSNSIYSSSSPTAPLTLSWTAATTNGGARLAGYDVQVYAFPATGAPWGDVIAKLYTTGTSLTIPTGLLSAGNYVFVIESVADATADA